MVADSRGPWNRPASAKWKISDLVFALIFIETRSVSEEGV
jgi:hypothetical protein